jgi:hypothetical protein
LHPLAPNAGARPCSLQFSYRVAGGQPQSFVDPTAVGEDLAYTTYLFSLHDLPPPGSVAREQRHSLQASLFQLPKRPIAADVLNCRTFATWWSKSEQVKYKISDIGINHLEAGTMFKKPETAGAVNITNIKGVTVVGDGNVVNTQLTDLSRALDDLDKAIAASKLMDEEKLMQRVILPPLELRSRNRTH